MSMQTPSIIAYDVVVRSIPPAPCLIRHSSSSCRTGVIRENVLGKLKVDMSRGGRVGKEVPVSCCKLTGLSVKCVALLPRLPPTVVRVNDAGPVLVLVAARLGKFEVDKCSRN